MGVNRALTHNSRNKPRVFFNHKTLTAVKQFQRKYETLKVDGVVGTRTWLALFKQDFVSTANV